MCGLRGGAGPQSARAKAMANAGKRLHEEGRNAAKAKADRLAKGFNLEDAVSDTASEKTKAWLGLSVSQPDTDNESIEGL